MAEPVVTLDTARVTVEPGGQATVRVTVFNPGTVVEGYAVDVVSAVPMPWATAAPTTLSVYPQQEESATVTFAPPPGPQTAGGTYPFGVRIRSQVDTERTAVAEGDLDVGAVAGLRATLTPATSSGRWRARHTLTVENAGNASVRLRVEATDPDQALGFLVTPALLEVPFGGQGYARVQVRTRHPFLRGSQTRLPFQVAGEREGAEPTAGPTPVVSTPDRPVADGAFVQKPILSRWVVLAGVLLLAGLVALLVWLLRGGETEPEEQSGVVLDAPTGVTAAAPSAGTVLLTWDAAQGADSYRVLQTRPTLVEQDITALVDPADPETFLVRLKVETAEEYCYQLQAVRESGGESRPSTPEACTTTTLAPEATPSPSPTVVEQLPPQGGEAPVPPASGGAAEPQSSPASPGEPTDAPLPFVSGLKFYVAPPAAPPAAAEADLAALVAAGVPAKLLHTSTVTLTPPFAADGWLLYVDAETPGDLTGRCAQIQASADAAAVPGIDCALAAPRSAAPGSTGPTTPAGSGAS